MSPREVAAAIRAQGGVCSLRTLSRLGISADRVERATARGQVSRVRPGWYSDGTAHPDVLRAVRAGGAISCVSTFRLLGAWTVDDEHLHVRMRRGTGAAGGTCLRRHWTDLPVTSPIDPLLESARCLARCLPHDDAVAVLDSVLHLGLLSLAELRRQSDPRLGRLLVDVDPRAESGLESLARLRLRRRRIRLRSQVPIPGVGRVDFLIGDRLILELDGKEFHDFDEDRARDRRSAVRDYLTIRASYNHVMTGWDALEAELLTLIRRDAHRRPHGGSTRAQGVKGRARL